MNYIALKGRIEQVIQFRPLDIEAYNDLFALYREYEKVDFTVAHEWNRAMRTQVGYGLRLAVEKPDFNLAERFNDLLFRSLLFDAPHFFDEYLQVVEFGKPLDKKFYQPRRHYLKRYVDAYQEILEGKLRVGEKQTTNLRLLGQSLLPLPILPMSTTTAMRTTTTLPTLTVCVPISIPQLNRLLTVLRVEKGEIVPPIW